ncbi:CotH kinase family protein [Leadbettera azotonutricia]|uniref:CotH protein n=1 Tax=Leadbettera azotonutricia (strain ATCC BAA-888 / DSM 13862 / ZAS-9) TaxID=545695 RepID=F5YB18_LEAAZ|nr:CotH kinase family protein [Leadbettera azotonutricia]AEF80179.1 CotH protein [Leadbettera azotonutricia ZAS-9]
MKKAARQIFFTLTLCILFAACSGSLLSSPEVPQVLGKGMVSVTVAGSGERTLLPQTAFSKYEYTFTRNGEAITLPDLSGPSETVSLEPGDWIISAKGFVTVNGEDYETAQGSRRLTVEAGNEYEVVIILDNPMGSAKGTFRYSVQFPGETTEAILKITAIMGSALPRSINLLAENSGSLDYPAGYYLVTILLDNGRINAGRTEIAHIYSNMETPLDAVFTESDFAAGIYLAGTVNISSPNGYHAETVLAYSDAACLNLIEGSETTGSDNKWSMRIPASYEIVYFQITLWKDNTRLISKAEKRVLRITGDEQIALAAKVFTITTISSIDSHGTVSANMAEAVEATPVTLTVDAAAGYRLKIDSPKATYGNGKEADITRDSENRNIYTLTMPAGNIAVNVEFIPISADLKSLSIRNSKGTEVLSGFDAAITDYTVFVVDQSPRVTITGSSLYAEDAVYNIVPYSDNRFVLNFGENTMAITVIAVDEKTGTEAVKTYNLKLIVSDIPVMSIDTSGRPIDSRDIWVEGASYELFDNNGMMAGNTDIKGRGNSTWLDWPKKAYALKCSKKTTLLGMPEHKRWNLLANYVDKTLLRNDVALTMGKIFEDGLRWTPRFRHIQLYVNDEYQGLYQLVEAIKIDANRVNVSEITKENPERGYILEIDARLGEVFNFTTTKGVMFTCSDPDENLKELINGDTRTIFEKIRTDVQHVEDILYSNNFRDPDEGYRKYLDIDSFVDWYLVNEITKNNDATFWLSTFMYYDSDREKYCMGPIWDFDVALGNFVGEPGEYAVGFYIQYSIWVSRLFEDPYFVSRVKEHWNAKKSEIVTLQQHIDESVRFLERAQDQNFKKWDILGMNVYPNVVVTGSYRGEIDYLKTWLAQRTTWLDMAINGL